MAKGKPRFLRVSLNAGFSLNRSFNPPTIRSLYIFFNELKSEPFIQIRIQNMILVIDNN